MTDDELIEAFVSTALPKELLDHRLHLRIAFLHLKRFDAATFERRLFRYVAAHGARAKYHCTITRAWLCLVASAIAALPELEDSNEFLEAMPKLLERDRLLSFYRRETLASAEARDGWCAPDVRPFSAQIAPAIHFGEAVFGAAADA